MEMECDLLVSNFNNLKTVERMKENIRRISEGSSSHSAGALKLGLEKAFDLRRNGAWLRCPYTACAWYTNYVSHSAIGQNALCQNCCDNGWGKRYLQCSGCGNNRTSNKLKSCQSCKKNFL